MAYVISDFVFHVAQEGECQQLQSQLVILNISMRNLHRL